MYPVILIGGANGGTMDHTTALEWIKALPGLFREWHRAKAEASSPLPEPKQSSVSISGTVNGLKFEAKEYDTTTDRALTGVLAALDRARREAAQ